VDVLAIANQLQYDPDNAAKTLALVKQLLHEGKLTPARIDESDARIVKLKERLGKIQEGRMVALVSERNRPLREINMKVKEWTPLSLLRRDTEFLRTNATKTIGARERAA
jgi:hypothetical protein